MPFTYQQVHLKRSPQSRSHGGRFKSTKSTVIVILLFVIIDINLARILSEASEYQGKSEPLVFASEAESPKAKSYSVQQSTTSDVKSKLVESVTEMSAAAENDTRNQVNASETRYVWHDDTINVQNNKFHTEAQEDGKDNFPYTFSTETTQSVWERLKNSEHFSKVRVTNATGFKRTYLPPPEFFRCDPCLCFKSTDQTINADCIRYTGMKVSLEFIPSDLPPSITHLSLDHNAIRHFETNILSSYKSILITKAPQNKITALYADDCQATGNLSHLDLSHNLISSLEDGALSCMPNLRVLILRGNHITNIANGTLAGLSHLELLDLAFNEITHIESGAFLDPRGLLVLDLSVNKNLALSPKYVETFRPLEKLEVFHIQGCTSMSGQYPTDVLSVLSALKELGVNGEVHPFDSKLSVLQNLTRLELGGKGFCHTKNFTKSYFNGLAQLESIKIEGCVAHEHSSFMFDANPNLKNFELSLQTGDLKDFFPILCFLPDFHKVTSVQIAYTWKRAELHPLITLLPEEVECLRNMTNLVSLDLEYNSISQVDRLFAQGLPKSLKKFSLRGNLLISHQSILYLLLCIPHILPSVKSLHEDEQGMKAVDKSRATQKALPMNIRAQHSTESDFLDYVTHTSLDLNSKEAQRNLLAGRQDFERLSGPTNSHTSLMDSHFHYLDFYTASNSMNLGLFAFTRTRKIQVGILNVSNTLITDWGYYPVELLPIQTVVADLSGNRCENFQKSFFAVNNSLIELHVQGNFLGPSLSKDINGQKLSSLTKLEYLDLSRNHMFYLPWLLLQALSHLQVLKLTSNNLGTFDLHIAHMKRLVFVDLARNSISSISERTRNELDALSSGRAVSVDLTYNPLPCSCGGIELLKWMSVTPARIMNKNFLVCLNDDNQLELVGDLSKRLAALQRECVSKKILIVVASFSVVLLLLLAGFVWVFQKRWWILYMWNLTVSKCYGYKTIENPGNSSAPGYTFDAFFVYSSSSSDFVLDECLEELEVNRSHRLCVEDRDFLPGSYVPCNITSAVRSSKTTVVVLDQNFRSVGWTHYAVEMAQVEAVRSRRNVLHLLFVGSSPDGPLSSTYLKLFKQGQFSEVPPRECPPDVREKFWDRFSRTLGHGDRRDNRPHPQLRLSD